jgi:hypothetical protein
MNVASKMICCFTLAILSMVGGCLPSAGENYCKPDYAEYVVHCAEISGSCGPLAARNYNSVSATDGGINTQQCEIIDQVGCTQTATNCKSKMVNDQGFDCEVVESYSTTFESDGTTGKSVTTFVVNCDNGDNCKSTYNCFFTRK